MQNAEGMSLDQIRRFLEGSDGLDFDGLTQGETYEWVEKTLARQEYLKQPKGVRGTLRAYLAKISGLSLPQITRLIRWYRQTGQVQTTRYRRHRFPTRYSHADIILLAEVDQAHERLSGPATRRILQREWEVFADRDYQRLAGISVSHIYNLRTTGLYRRHHRYFQKTKPSPVAIGERRRPDPQGRPGYLRVDTVHQGDREGEKGVYHVNAVDAVTQWEVLGCAAQISEAYLEPILEAMLHQFPFDIHGFHADNGSEFINYTVAKLLNKLLVEFTKSRPRHSNDNALVEAKNGSIVRKHLGYSHIPGQHAEAIQRFYMGHFNPYLNYHRPCGFATVEQDARGKEKKIYQTYATPYERLKTLPEAARYLKPGITFPALDRIANACSDTAYARRLQQEKQKLFRLCATTGQPLPPALAVAAPVSRPTETAAAGAPLEPHRWVNFRAVKEAVSMAMVLEAYPVKGLRKSGGELRGRCPIHRGEGRDAFHVNLSKNAFHCFACEAGGNVLDFVAAMEHCSIREAALQLQRRFMVAGSVEKPKPLCQGQGPTAELVTKRKNPPLGFVLQGVDSAHPYLAERGIRPETAQAFQVGRYTGKGLLRGRLVIPIHDQQGQLIAYAGRSLDGSEPKYKFPPGWHKSLVLFNLHRVLAARPRRVIVVEGFFDCLQVHQAGFPHVVALLGVSLSAAQQDLLVRHFQSVVLLLDGDRAGRAASARIFAQLSNQLSVKVLKLPAGKQPDQLCAADLRRLLRGSEATM